MNDPQRDLAALQFIALRERTPLGGTILWVDSTTVDTYANNCGFKKIQNPHYGLTLAREHNFKPYAILLPDYIAEDETNRKHFVCHGCGVDLKKHE